MNVIYSQRRNHQSAHKKEAEMIRSQLISREMAYILLALAGLALVLLVINVILLETPGVQYGSSEVVQSAPGLSPYWRAEADRWNAMADYYAGLNAAPGLSRYWQAEADRWNAMADYYAGLTVAQKLSRSWQADAARWNAMAEYYESLKAGQELSPS
jgi:hypothetical protein